MPTLIDTSLWVDFLRTRTPRFLKRFIATHFLNPAAHIAEPIAFEILRNATSAEAGRLKLQLQTLPVLPTPDNLWSLAATLGQACRSASFTVGSLDLLIAALAIHHDAELVSFDSDFLKLASVSKLRIKLLVRPAS